MKNKECECGECDECIQAHIDFYEQLEQKKREDNKNIMSS